MALKLDELNLGTLDDFIRDMVPFFYGRPLNYVDVGAFTGETFISMMNSKLPIRESLLVEPNPASIVELQKKIDLVGNRKLVYLHKCAVGATEGHVELKDSRGMTKVVASVQESKKTKNDDATGKFSVPIKTLDNLVQEMSSNHISILKIDVEGFEIDVLKGAESLLSQNDVDVIYIEAGMNLSNKQQVHYREIEDFLLKYNYRIFRFYEQMFEWTEDSPLLRRVNIAFMSEKFASNNPYRLSQELFRTKELLKKTRRELTSNTAETEGKKKQNGQSEKAISKDNASLNHSDKAQIEEKKELSTKTNISGIFTNSLAKFKVKSDIASDHYSTEPASKLKRLVFLVPDLSTMGGIQLRTRMVVTGAIKRNIEYICVSYRRSSYQHIPGNIVYEDAPDELMHLLNSWDPSDTAIVFPNNTMRNFPERVRKEFNRFPLIFNGSGQLAFMLQDSTIIFDSDYVDNLKVTKHVLLSFMDRMTYSQLGIYNHILGFNPVKSRAKNTFDTNQNKYFGYIGRIDFYAKGSERLIEIAIALRDLNLGPLKVFTVSNPKNSPQIDAFYALIEERGVKDDIDIIIDQTDNNDLYKELACLFLPSKKESFGNVILEAYSYGIPVISSAYAPGPAQLIEHGETGYLLEDFDVETIKHVLSLMDKKTLETLSKNAFEKHKDYRLDAYYDFIEGVGESAVSEFNGENLLPVYPKLKITTKFEETRRTLQKKSSALRVAEKKLALAQEKQNQEATKSSLKSSDLNSLNSKKENTSSFYAEKPASKLKRLVFLVPDLSTMGGIQLRTRMVVTGANKSNVEYVCISRKNLYKTKIPGNIVYEDAPDELMHLLNSWDPSDTAIVFPNNTMRNFPERVRKEFNRFPLIFNGSGQLAFMLQDSTIMFDSDYVDNLKVTKHVLLSFMDRMTYSQLGIYNHVLGFNPVKSRAKNTFDTQRNKYFGYIGRIDFYAKGAERLVEIAIALRDLKLGPLKVFTASNPKNSPQIKAFYALIQERGVKNDIDIVLDETNNNVLYDELAGLFLPSKKESFGNVILEAYSYGIPVISSAYAPGPAQLIEHGETGYLLEDFDVETIKQALSLMDEKTLETLSKNAFEKHKDYRLDAYYDFIEGVGEAAVSEFNGENLLPVYPKLKITTKFEETQKALASVRQSTSFRLGHSIVKKIKLFMPSGRPSTQK